MHSNRPDCQLKLSEKNNIIIAILRNIMYRLNMYVNK